MADLPSPFYINGIIRNLCVMDDDVILWSTYKSTAIQSGCMAHGTKTHTPHYSLIWTVCHDAWWNLAQNTTDHLLCGNWEQSILLLHTTSLHINCLILCDHHHDQASSNMAIITPLASFIHDEIWMLFFLPDPNWVSNFHMAHYATIMWQIVD